MYEHLLPAMFPRENTEIHYYTQPRQAKELVFTDRSRIHALGEKISYYFLKKLKLRTQYHKWIIKKIITKHQADLIIFNTIDQPSVYAVFKSLREIEKIGVVHNVLTTNYYYNDHERYFCVNEYIYYNVRSQKPIDGYFISFFPPILYSHSLPKNKDKIIAVQGLISFNRRDYDLLIKICSVIVKENCRPCVKFNIVGSVKKMKGKVFLRKVNQAGLEDFFIFHDWLNDADFFREIYESDFIMPLVAEKKESYFIDKISSSYERSAAYKKPMIVSETIRKAWLIDQDVCLSYSNFDELLHIIKNIDSVPKDLGRKYTKFIDTLIGKNKQFLSMTYDQN